MAEHEWFGDMPDESGLPEDYVLQSFHPHPDQERFRNIPGRLSERIAELESEVSLYRSALERIATFREDRPAPTPEAEIAQDALKGDTATEATGGTDA